MIETADTDYAADYDIDYEKPIKSRCFDQNSPPNCIKKPEKIPKTFFSYRAPNI